MEITLRCFSERRRDGTWYAHCIDLTLDAEADSYLEARKKLDVAIIQYLEWALETAHSKREILRPSPLVFRLRYRRAWAKERLRTVKAALTRRRLPAGIPEAEFVTHPNLTRARERMAVPA
ncbi:MAG: hypothetical protein WD557_10525 [Dehalococcoidia bacterium]